MKKAVFAVSALAALCAASAPSAAPGGEDPQSAVLVGGRNEPPALAETATAAEILRSCRSMLPSRPVELRGRIVRRNRKGIPSREYKFILLMDRSRQTAEIRAAITAADSGREVLRLRVARPRGGDASVEIQTPGGGKENPELSGQVLGTDVTWLDLTLDFLWWTDASFETERTGETVHGQECLVIIAKPPKPLAGVDAVRLWADRRTGCMMQAEQLDADGKGGWKSVRRLWGTRLKKFAGHETIAGKRVETKRWMASAIEVQRAGGIHRTKIEIESVNDEPSGPEVR